MSQIFFGHSDLHPPSCKGTTDDLGLLRTRVLLTNTSAPLQLQDALCCAARAGHRKCIRFLLRYSNLNMIPEDVLRYIVHTTLDSDSTLTMTLGFKMLQLVSAEERPSIISDLVMELVWHKKHRNLEFLLDTLLSASCSMQESISEAVFKSNPLRIAIWWKRPECLRLLLRHGAVLNSPKLTNAIEISGFDQDEVVRIFTLVKYLRSDDVQTEIRLLEILHEFGCNLWEIALESLTPINFPVNILSFIILDHLCNEEWRDEVAEALQQMMAQPRTLLSSCRLAVVKALGPKNYVAKTHQLTSLPNGLKDYLRFEDLRESSEDEEKPEEMTDSSDDEDFEKLLREVDGRS